MTDLSISVTVIHVEAMKHRGTAEASEVTKWMVDGDIHTSCVQMQSLLTLKLRFLVYPQQPRSLPTVLEQHTLRAQEQNAN